MDVPEITPANYRRFKFYRRNADSSLKERKEKGVRKVNISSVDMSGAMTGASVAVAAPGIPGRTMESPQPAQTTGGNAEASAAHVKQMVAEMQSHLDSMNVSLQYSLYGKNGDKIAVKVVDKETGDVIREIPSKEIQSLQAKMSELCGMIFNGQG
ncbi:MAG: flagellar protein FlaG [Deltaproteobacteria bacterium]|nr:flagellar protein FlaG [Deltaproteobacteria bacterium]